MAIDLSDLDMPTVDAHLLVFDNTTPNETRNRQINTLLELSKENWIAKSVLGYYVFRHKDVSNILKDKRWHSGLHALHSLRPGADPEVTSRRGNTLSAMDGDEHTFIRNLVTPAFSKSAAKTQKDFAYQCAKDLFQDIIKNEHKDFYRYFCEKYPMLVLCNTIGLPKDDWEMFIEWGKALASPITSNDPINLDSLKSAESDFFRYMSRLASKRRVQPENDLITSLATFTHDGRRLSDSQIALIMGTMISGGVETLISHLGMMFTYLASNPDIYSQLNKNNIPEAVIEISRLTSSVRGSLRIASEDIVYNEVLFPKGTFLFVNIASANRDRTLYDNPDDFQFGRKHGNELTFGAGMHYCLGSHLAKLEMAEIVSAMVDIFKSISVESISYRPSNSGIFAPTELSINYTERE